MVNFTDNGHLTTLRFWNYRVFVHLISTKGFFLLNFITDLVAGNKSVRLGVYINFVFTWEHRWIHDFYLMVE